MMPSGPGTRGGRRLRRRELLRLTAAGTVGLLGLRSGVEAAEPPPETTRIRLVGGCAHELKKELKG